MTTHLHVQVVLVFALTMSWVRAIPVGIDIEEDIDNDQFVQEYADMKHSLVYDFGYSKEFADLVEINLKKAVLEEKTRQKLEGPIRLRQVSEEYDEDDTTNGPTTARASPGDVVRGVAGILTGLGTFNAKSFWQAFVNFFPPNQREGAQALVDASLGKRPLRWPTTTTKLTTTTKDEDEIDSEETTKSVPAVTSATVLATTRATSAATAAVATSKPVATATVSLLTATEAGARASTIKYTLIKRRPTSGTENEGLRVDDLFLGGYGQQIKMPYVATTPVTSKQERK